ncbi:head maturation protease, ClpP-related [Brucella anthropi]|uniref:head maturation protease, ClpP-related n=1 Tax=Brucella/Ochrobactrum group TaxID=2826938 RepID=UPI00124E1429|nr:head maturation protease, ClpP-related [Brucella anthropi]KAB2779439.1 Clp protease ClpP [Brucella anthropi]MCH4540193.1 ATP-dependent Clp protease proteolytic subunit [Ochrobactrum sp. A-1]
MPVLQDGELVLYGFVGDNYWDEGFTAQDVLAALAEVGRDTDITVRINSAGGYVYDGVAIYNALVGHKGKVTVVVDAFAGSAASVIAMAGEERIMRTGAMMMIHDPASVTYGNADDHEAAVGFLNKLGDLMADIYAERTGEDTETIRADMRKEIWLTGEEAVARGFATETEKLKAVAYSAFDYRIYANAPARLKRMAQKNSWSLDREMTASAPAGAPTSQEEDDMTEKPQAGPAPADIATATANAEKATKERIKAIMTSPEASGREELASHFAYDTTMSAEDAVKALTMAPKAEATGQPEPDPAQDYEQRRMLASGQSQPQPPRKPGTPTAKINTGEIYASRRQAAK